MVTVNILGKKGHEQFVDLTPEEAEELIEETIDAEGQRYFVVDKDTQKIVKELKLQEDQELVLIPIAQGG